MYLFLILFLTACSFSHQPFGKQNEMLKVCWGDSEQALVSEACMKPEYIKWNEIPLSVSSSSSLKIMTIAALKTWNKALGFEMFTYSTEENTDIAIVRTGPSNTNRGLTFYFKKNKELHAGVLIFVDI